MAVPKWLTLADEFVEATLQSLRRKVEADELAPEATVSDGEARVWARPPSPPPDDDGRGCDCKAPVEQRVLVDLRTMSAVEDSAHYCSRCGKRAGPREVQ